MSADQKPVIKLKLKLGNKVIASAAIVGSKPVSISQDRSYDSRELLQRCGKEERKQLLSQARATQAQLHDYVGPTASPSAIVACLRQGEPFSLSAALPKWDFTVDFKRAEDEETRQAKRQRTSAATQQQPQQQPKPEAVTAGAPAATKSFARSDGPAPLGKSVLSKGAPVELAPQQQLRKGGATDASGLPTESNSDQATNSQIYMPTSPDNCIQQVNSGSQRGAAPAQRKPGAGDAGVGTVQQQRSSLPGPSARAAVATCSQGVQVGSNDFPTVPVHFLEHASTGGVSSAFATLGAFDFHMPPDAVSSTSASSIERTVEQKMQIAKQTKRDGDASRGGLDRPWTIKSLAKYVESGVMFMECCDWMLLAPKAFTHARVAELYMQTSELLATAAKFADSIRNGGMRKEALRILAERLVAVCCLRSASYMSSKLMEYSKRATEALADYQKKKEQARAVAVLAKASDKAGADKPSLSPDGSTQSSLEHQPVAAPPQQPVQPPQQLLDMQGRLVSEAKKISKFSEYVRKSTSGFQTFLERQDVQQDQNAKLVSMHLAALCVDMGLTPGSKIIGHARDALSSICFGDLRS